MKKLLLSVAIATAGLMTSCAVSEHLSANRNVMQTNVELSKKNFQVIGAVKGSATVSRVFGIGGLSLKAIRANAYAEMVKNANLSGSQALINVNTEVKQRGVPPLYWETIVTTHGQVIEFLASEEQVTAHDAKIAKRIVPAKINSVESNNVSRKLRGYEICYLTDQNKPISAKIETHPQFANNEYVNGQGIITFKDAITTIPSKAFFACRNLISVIIPEGIIEIENSAFARCNHLKEIYCQSAIPPTLGDNALWGISREAKIYVPQASVDIYKAADGWENYTSKIVGRDFQ